MRDAEGAPKRGKRPNWEPRDGSEAETLRRARGRGRGPARGPGSAGRTGEAAPTGKARQAKRRVSERGERERRRETPRPRPERQEHVEPEIIHERLTATAVSADAPTESFADLGIGTGIVGALGALGIDAPFPIQAATIPPALEGRDVLGRARTGSGKTIAFGAPVVELLLRNRPKTPREQGRPPRALILAPTRELAEQINKQVSALAKAVGIFTAVVTGGVRQDVQERALGRGVDILIGTPGRIEDLIVQGILNLGRVEIAVLDEADHMAELGFVEAVQRLLRQTRPDSQKLLFSATLDAQVQALIQEFLRDPAILEVGDEETSGNLTHLVLVAERDDKDAVLEQLAGLGGKAVVFTRTRAYAGRLAEQFAEAGLHAAALHGDLTQARRSRNLEQLRKGKVQVLVATDVAARGIHVDDIDLVVQADPPDEYKTYVHRAGRTGRAGKSGTVVTVIAPRRKKRMGDLLENAGVRAPMIPVTAADDIRQVLASALADD